LEKIIFGDPNDIINNLSDDESDTHIQEEKKSANKSAKNVHNNEDEIRIENDALNSITHTTDQKEAAWVDEDDTSYRFIYELFSYLYLYFILLILKNTLFILLYNHILLFCLYML